MGKSKRKTKLSALHRQSKCWPLISCTDIKAEDLKTTQQLIGDQLLAEIQTKLISGRPADRCLATDMIVNSMADFDNYSNKELIELIRTLSPICLDRAENCRTGAIDSLCYLSSISDKLCDIMIGADVLTPIITLFNTYFGSDFDWSQKQKSQLLPQIYINSCRLLTNLCGTSSKALNIFNNSNLIKILINGLKAFKANIEVSIASAQCLSVVVEENQIPELLIPENTDLIKNLIQNTNENSSQLHLSNIAATIAVYLGFGTDTSALQLIFKLINQTLSVSFEQKIKDFSQLIEQYLENGKTVDSLKDSSVELKNLLLAKRVSLELITNITGANDNTGSDEEMMDCDEEDMDNSDEESATDQQMSASIEDIETTIPSELEKILLNESIHQKICEYICDTIEDEVKQSLSKHNFGTDILNCIQCLQLCSLTCVHNLVECIAKEKLQISEEIWKQICRLSLDCNLKDNNTITQQLIEESTNTMRAIIGRNEDIGLTGDQLEKLCVLCQTFNTNSIIKINVINLMSVCAQRTTDLEFIEKIAVLLLTGLQNESDLVIRAELFDALIDIFSEDFKTDSIAIRLQLISRMKELALVFKREANKSRELKRNPIISTVILNLMPFIKYKQKMLK